MDSLDGFSEKETNIKTESYVSSYKDNEIDESERLGFAKNILLGLFWLVVVVFLASYLSVALVPSSNKEELLGVVSSILDVTKTAVPSIVTLVLGFYFGRKE